MRIPKHLLLGAVGTVLAASAVALFPSPVLGDTGCPTAAAPSLVSGTYEVDTAAKLQWVKDSGSMSASYKLTADINMSGCTWTRGIGTYGAPFTGTFDGNGKTVSTLTVVGSASASGLGLVSYLSGSISNITLSSPTVTGGTSNDYGGLVGKVNASGTVSGATLTSVSVSGGQQTGGAIGSTVTGSTVTNVSVSGSVSATSGVGGGVVGTSTGTLSGLTSTATVTGSYTLGGLLGSLNNGGVLTNSSASGSVTGTSSSVGGAVGSVSGSSPTCPSLVTVTSSGAVNGTSSVGGLVGDGNCFSISRSSSSSVVTGTSFRIGGLMGYENVGGTYEKSFFTGQVQGTDAVGGLVGASRSTITDSYSTGSVTATSAANGGRAGGLVGWLLSGAVISRTYATGSITPPSGDNSTVGGLIGQYNSGTITAGLWDTQTTGRSTSQGTGAKGHTSQQLKDYVLYDSDNLNWDITDGISPGNGVSSGTVWSVCSGVNSGYPFLTWQGLSGACRPTMAYNGNGNSTGSAPADSSTPYASGDTVTVVGNTGGMTKSGQVFSGWNTKADGTGSTYSATDTFTITAPVMLFANWTTNPQIIYNPNGGTGSIANTSGTSGSTVTLSNGAAFTRTGYMFTRWNTSSSGSGTPYSKNEPVTMPAGGMTLYAVWTALPAVTYNANGGSGTVAAQYALAGDSVVLSTGSGLTRAGYVLSRWDTSSGGTGTPYSKGETVTMPVGGLVLHAVWTSTSTTTTTSPSSTTTTVQSSAGTSPPSTSSSPGGSAAPPTAGSGSGATGTTAPGSNVTSTPGTTAAVVTGSSSTTTTSSPAPTGQAPPAAPAAPPGQLLATVGGSPAEVTIEEVDGALVARVGSATVKYAVMSREGVRRAVSGTTVLELAAGDSVTLDFEGFENGSQARAWIVPGDILLGRATLAGGKGTVTGGVPLGSQAGERRIVSEAKSADGKAVVVAFGVKVTNGDAGGTPWSLIFLLVVGMAVTAGLLVPAARRKRDED